MNTIDSSRLLSEMSRMAQAAGIQTTQSPNAISPVISQEVKPSEFSNLLVDALGKVNELSMTAGDLSDRLIQGDPSVSIAQSMIAGQKAGVAFEATLQVRNRLVQAYQDIMNMSV